jgi:hypothetical protein
MRGDVAAAAAPICAGRQASASPPARTLRRLTARLGDLDGAGIQVRFLFDDEPQQSRG